MSTISGYPARSFDPSQKFLVLDPSTQTTALVLGSDLVSYITPSLDVVRTNTTRAAALNEDYEIGTFVQTAGGAAIDDGGNGMYLVVAAGDGDYAMLNGNELLLLPFGTLVGSDLDGALVTDDGVQVTIQSAIAKREVHFSSLESLRASTCTYDYVTVDAANEGGSTGRMELYNNGTTGTPTTNGNRFSALSAGTFFNAAGIGYSLQTDQEISVFMFGAVGDGSTDDTAAITAALDALSASGGLLYFPAGTYVTDGGHTLPQMVSLFGDGMGVSIIKHVTADNVLFDMPLVGGNEATVEYGGNVLRDLTAYGTSAANTAAGLKIKNKVNVKLDHVELYNFGNLVSGVRDNASNSVNAFTADSCRFGACKTAIYAPRSWNGVKIGGGTSFSGFTDWAVIAYDSDGIDIDSSVAFDASPTATGAGHVFLGGCSGFSVGPYCEGNPDADHFICVASAKDKDGNATLGGIALNSSRGGVLHGLRASSAGGTDYVVKLDGCRGVSIIGRASTGINVAMAYMTDGTIENTVRGFANPGTLAVFATAANEYSNDVTQSAYKASTFTPTLLSGGAAVSRTYSSQIGRYARVGSRVYFEIQIVLTAKGSSTGSTQIGGLPFNKSASSPTLTPCAVIAQNLTFTGQLTPAVAGGTTAINIYTSATGASATLLSDTALANNTELYLSGHYEV